MEVVHIQKGKPQQNGFAERFNEPFRYEFLGAYLFDSLSQVREMVWLWRLDYNDERLHKFRGICRPVAICRRWKTLVQRCLTEGEVDTWVRQQVGITVVELGADRCKDFLESI